jgi:hypothetical protein
LRKKRSVVRLKGWWTGLRDTAGGNANRVIQFEELEHTFDKNRVTHNYHNKRVKRQAIDSSSSGEHGADFKSRVFRAVLRDRRSLPVKTFFVRKHESIEDLGSSGVRHQLGPLKCRGKRAAAPVGDATSCQDLYKSGVKTSGYHWIRDGEK